MVDAAKLADERPPGAGGLPAGESGHADNHVDRLCLRAGEEVVRLTLICSRVI
jgi:hypothetical protein